MNISLSSIRRIAGFAAVVGLAGSAFGYEYKVCKPSEALRPQLRGAAVGQWTLDYEAAAAAAKSTGKVHIMMVTGSWWCPYCQRFEESVLRSEAWKNYVEGKGCYLSMLDYPYRFHVDDEQLWKSKYPEKGDGWGFQCWLYDDDYLSENGISAEEGFKTIHKFYEKQDALALDTAESNIIAWDNGGTFNLHKVAYPSLIVFLPDGTEAGRFNAQAIYRLPAEEAQSYVFEHVDSIIESALEEQCGLCSDPDADECGIDGERAVKYNGWLCGAGGAVGTISVQAGKANRKGEVTVKADLVLNGKKIRLMAKVAGGCEAVEFAKGEFSAVLKLGVTGLSGTFYDRNAEYVVKGARDAFSAGSGEPKLKARAAMLEKGSWTFAMRPEESDYAFAGGYGAMVFDVGSRGVTKVSGLLGDGTKVRATAQMIVGDNGVFCLPVVVNPYPGKTGGFGCCLWFKDGQMFNVTEATRWSRTKAETFSVKWAPICSALPGTGVISDEMELLFVDPPKSMNGNALVLDPQADSITFAKNRLKGTAATDFNARLAPKTGLFSGSMHFLSDKGDGSYRRKRGVVYGMFSGGTGYGTVFVSGVGSWAVKLASCAACED